MQVVTVGIYNERVKMWPIMQTKESQTPAGGST